MKDKEYLTGIAVVSLVMIAAYLFIALSIGMSNAQNLSKYCTHEDGRPYSSEPKPTGRYWVSDPFTLGTTGTCKEVK